MAAKLKQEVVDQLKERIDIKRLIAKEFGLEEKFGIRTVNRWLKINKPNSPLTCKAVLVILSKHLFTLEKNLLTNEPNTQRIRSADRVRPGKGCKANC